MEKQRKPRVLLTGFTPFGGERINPALEAVNRVRCPEAELRILEVPTVFGDSARLVTAEMDAFRPDVVLCVGQAAGRSAVTRSGWPSTWTTPGFPTTTAASRWTRPSSLADRQHISPRRR